MEAASKHATKVQGSCSACHVPHGPKVPATAPVCAACHTSVSLPGLHKVSGHATCATCHTPHGAPNADRANCLTCHAKQKDHEPAATQCNGCHPFRK
jgi:hypothetical protein